MRKLLFAFLLPGILISCSDDEGPTAPVDGTLTLSLNGLEDLGSSAQYEGWVLVDPAAGPVSTGTFTVDGSGNLSQTTFSVDAATLDGAIKFILTVEPIPDADPAPSDQKLIAGDFSGNSAAVSTSVGPAIGDFSSAAGTMFLRSPTDEDAGNNGNDENGIWFGAPGMPPTANFTLPTLPTGWAYEGWVIGDAGPISTGTFTDFGDRDSGNPFSGIEANAGPPVPGEDFFLNAPAGETFPLDVRGRTVVISVEPVPDNSPAPFLLKPLLGTLAADAETAPATHDFGQNLGSLPTGTASR